MIKTLRTFFSPSIKEERPSEPCLNLAVFPPMAQETITLFMDKVSAYLSQSCERTVLVDYFTDIKNDAEMKKVAAQLRNKENCLIFAMEALPTEHLTALQTTHNLAMPAVAVVHEGLAPTAPPPHTNVLIYPNHASTIAELFHLYGDPLKQVIIVGRSSALHVTPMIQKLAHLLKEKNTTVVYLEIDKEVGDLPRFMATHAPHSKLIYISPDAYAIGHQFELIALANKYNCRSISSMDNAIDMGASASVGINLDDMAKDTARSLALALNNEATPPIRKIHAPLTIKLSRTKKRPQLKKIENLLIGLDKEDQLIM